MDFHFAPHEDAFRRELQEFLGRELPPDWPGETGDDAADWAFTFQMRRKLAQRGWIALHWPREYGGAGASTMMQVIFTEEMSYHLAPGFDQFGVRMMGSTLLVHGTEEQKRKFLPPVARGEVQWCQGYSEPGSGSDLASLQTRAVRDGDDYVVHGTKIWTSAANHADWMMLLARTDPEAPKHRGISFLLLDMKTPGVTVRPIVSMAGIPRFNQVFFDGVRVPRANLVGGENQGWYVGATLLDFERSGIEYSATSRRTIKDLVGLARETLRNGRPLATDPLFRNRLADLAIQTEVSRMLSYHITWLQGQGRVPNKEASVGKAFGTEVQQRVAQFAMQVLGLHGQLAPGSRWAPLQGRLERLFLNSFSSTIAAGTSEVQRNIIAQRGLGLPRE